MNYHYAPRQVYGAWCSVHSLYTNWQIYRVAKMASLWIKKKNHILLVNVICVVSELLCFFSLKKVKLKKNSLKYRK